MLSHKSSLWHSLFVLLLVRTVFAQNWPCFEPDLSPVTSYDYLPCPNQANLPSMCCATNRTSFPDSCQDNGLCQSLVPNSAGTDIINQNIWRESCSDPTWHSPFCLKLCINGTGPGGDGNSVENYASSDTLVTQCPDGSFCCGQNNTNCCNAGQGTQIASIIGISPTSTSTTSSTIRTATSTSTSSATSSPLPSPASSSLGTGAKVGMGVGIAIALLLAILLGVFFTRRRKMRDRKLSKESMPLYDTAPKKDPALSELNNSQFANELPSGNTRVAYELGNPIENQPWNELSA